MIGSLGVLAMAIILGGLGWWVDHSNRKSMEPRDEKRDNKHRVKHAK